MKEIKGMCPIIPTPYTVRGEVDYDGLRSILKTRAEAGVDAFTLFGIGGEYYKQSDEESRQMVKVVVDECHRLDIPLIISVTQHATIVACKWAQYLEAAGADCLMVLPPFFLKPSGEDVYQHTKAIADAVKIPILAQYAPEQTGVSIGPDVWKRLSEECANAKYFKIECKPSGAYISKMMNIMKPEPRIFIGNCGLQMIEAFDRGAIGVMPGSALAEIYIKIYREFFAGRRDEAIRYHNAILPLYNHIRQNVEMVNLFEKRILKLRGIIESDFCRKPCFMPDQEDERLFRMYYEQLKPLLES